MVQATVEVLGLSRTLSADHALLGQYSEGRGLLAALVEAGVVEDTGRRMPTAYVELPLVKVLL